MGEFTIQTLGRGSRDRTHVNMLIYGRSGAGKTYMAATAPDPFLMAFDPRGHDSVPYEIPGQLITDLATAKNVIEWIEAGHHQQHGIKTLIVDGLFPFAFELFYGEKGAQMVDEGRAPDVDRLPYGGGLEVKNPYQRMMLRLINLTQLEPENYRVHVVFTTLDESVKEAENAIYQVRPYFGSKSINQQFPALFSVIGYIAAQGDEDEEGQPIMNRRILFTDYRGILARDRLGIFPLMGEIPNLSEFLH